MELQTILIIVGAVGVIIVSMYSISMGISNNTITMPKLQGGDSCSSNPGAIKIPKFKSRGGNAAYNLSTLPSAGNCPIGYTHFADGYGNALCCASRNIDIFSHVCGATGAEGVCAMAPGIVDTRNLSGDVQHYPVCQEIARQQQESRSGQLCPRFFPNYVNIPGTKGLHKCCRNSINASKTDCENGTSCMGLSSGQNMFNTPESCETKLLLEKLTCPIGTNMVETLKGTSARTKDLSMPVCVGVKGNCLDSKVLTALRQLGYFQDIDPAKNIMNCDVYNKVYNERLWTQGQAEMKYSSDLG